jgi:hypothetical protein
MGLHNTASFLPGNPIQIKLDMKILAIIHPGEPEIKGMAVGAGPIFLPYDGAGEYSFWGFSIPMISV